MFYKALTPILLSCALAACVNGKKQEAPAPKALEQTASQSDAGKDEPVSEAYLSDSEEASDSAPLINSAEPEPVQAPEEIAQSPDEGDVFGDSQSVPEHIQQNKSAEISSMSSEGIRAPDPQNHSNVS